MLNLDSLFIRKMAPGGKAKAPPDKGAARFFYLAYTHLAKLVGLNMLFLLCCIPIITIPAALSGLNRVCLLLIRQGTCSVWYDFINEVKTSFLRSIPLGLLCGFLFADATFCLYLGRYVSSAGLAVALLIAALALYSAAILMNCYTFALLSFVSLKNADIFRNAVLLILLKPRAAFLLLLVVGGGIAAGVWFLPYSIPIISLIGLSLLSLAACTTMNGPIQTCIVDRTNKPT